ncbi:NAD(P)-dependent dehydrogenase (short-subunit alcohol dehydrogenase family) [Sphingomonas kaistensis]|uniref:NAD(P)-dependent dehydrogenase (Short-subunit alcohol dehydrogenase family) n=1 Tax=Sphingomonas kaistensis TaxID=298708 RepID=A0A7X5Y329_9SPHN|nr:SDR family NAD(P)-dependent oxidoreductase [Sphingomonas kaistensis]NJC04289.1 NAD(P)-dependent dehydrogenase (short-subunit alcohol dehydrogenase family) [Sphingomonas kaistensis]
MDTIVIGASGGIGAALADRFEAGGDRVHRLSRSAGSIDLADPASIAAAADSLPFPAVQRLVVATGLLHDDGLSPERSLRDLDAERLGRSFLVNTVGPALVLRHFAPLLAREGRVEVAMLSARVGSIADNRLGGWYGYRASKAALNQIVRTAAVEVSRSRPESVVVALHPGTVDTAMSRPFQANVAAERLFTPRHSADCLADVLARLGPADSGGFFDWQGQAIPF